MAATNRRRRLDPALLRPGRFDRKVVVDRPDLQGRIAILKIHARNKPWRRSDLAVLARRTPGSPEQTWKACSTKLLSWRPGQPQIITMEDCEESIDRVLMGPEKKNRVMSDMDRKVFAYHEAGHAVVAHYSEHGDPVHKVTIVAGQRRWLHH